MTTFHPLYLMDLAGVAVFAISGTLVAGRKHLDWLGALVLATVTAIGGGTLRDVLIDRHPVFWMNDTLYLWVILCTTLFTMLYARYWPVHHRALLLADALGLALFAISGAQIAENAGFHGSVAIILGTMTGTAGGAVRDILAAEIPLVLRDREFYATAAIIGIAVYLGLEALSVERQLAAYVGMATVALTRILSIFWGLKIPAVRLPARH